MGLLRRPAHAAHQMSHSDQDASCRACFAPTGTSSTSIRSRAGSTVIRCRAHAARAHRGVAGVDGIVPIGACVRRRSAGARVPRLRRRLPRGQRAAPARAERGTPAGFECARLILGAYLRHGEFDLVDDWVVRMGQSYGPPLLAASLVPRLRVEVAYLFGNAPLKFSAAPPKAASAGLERLTILSRAADRPLSFDARDASCDSPACTQLRRILDDRASLPHKSPGPGARARRGSGAGASLRRTAARRAR